MKKRAIITLSLALLWVSCSTGPNIAGTTDEQLTGTTKAILFNPDFTPARNARVKFFSVSDTSKLAKSVAYTDSNGYYAPVGLTMGQYNIMAQKDTLVAFQDSVFIFPDTNYIQNDTLQKPGSFTAIAAVQPNHNVRTVTVQVMGTDKYVDNVDSVGRFTLKGMAQGNYTLRLTSTLPEYTPTYKAIAVESDINDTLVDTIRLIYTGVQVVSGLKAAFDTLNGVVTVLWNSSGYADLQDFLIYKDYFDSVNLSTIPVASTNDTFWQDTVFKLSIASGRFSMTDINDYRFKYRVAIRNNSQKVGDTYRYASVVAASPLKVVMNMYTSMMYKFNGQPFDSVSINDTVRVIQSISNPNRWIKKISWFDPLKDSVVKVMNTADSSTKILKDTLNYSWATTGLKRLVTRVEDGAGVVWVDTVEVKIGEFRPVVVARADTAVSFVKDDSVRVVVQANDVNPTGSVVKYYWDVGADGVWEDSTTVGVYRVDRTDNGGPVTVRWKVKDDDGWMSGVDSFVVVFVRPPTGLGVSVPTTNTGWYGFNYSTGKGTLPITFLAVSADSSVDILRYTLFTGATAGALVQQYSGLAAGYKLQNVDTMATVYWRLVVCNRFGDSVQTIGTFVTLTTPPPPAGMKLIPAGTFEMGQVGLAEPVHSVTLSAFWMDSTEVMQSDYLALMGVNPSYISSVTRGPVETVTWFDAVLYCNKRSKRDGKDTVYKYTSITGTAGNGCTALDGLVIDNSKSGYRLPTEAEWEYACRAGTTTDYYWGSSIDSYAWYSNNSGNTTHTVATKLPNGWGLYDMSGNVWEWCNDWYASYSSGAQTDPQGATSGSVRVLRGSSWNDNTDRLRSASRSSGYPNSRGSNGGFRAVCSQ